MKVTRVVIAARGLLNRCPNCGGATLFRKGSPFKVNRDCPACGLRIERDDGFYIGSMSLNYGVTLVCYLLPLLLLAYRGKIDPGTAAIAAGVGALAFPIAFYRSSRSWWLAQYYLLFPHQLPANRAGDSAEGGDHNT